ncbi:ectonucleotide pyrophosphatase/phosphodiesterase [Mucilaginibacter sp. UR6-1]|uniref:alkaline phosphatase family protein n=1 Tax=Mucilaginibacter sp. UR6-1 TaxID=1435643 RepID=UPI001E37113A|nr:ectonucleotide pyrophosphatase/phosphodiesterase [Mucilaginibacter sp. UR6-1]MCC8409967.1 ectonucleotide pyrophosphatase/phosphodiesterase [Mucilaginibacter sp. UR6-1]
MKHFFIIPLLLLFISSYAQTDTTQKVIAGRKNSLAQQNKPYVILISSDAFRYDFAKKYNAQHLLAFSDSGVRADAMIPSYPSLTFPNHYALVTGMYPSHSGLVHNNFYDPATQKHYNNNDKKAVADSSWYGGTPLWVLAEKQQMLAASFYWVAAEAPIQGVNPTYYYNYNNQIPIGRRIQKVGEWLRLPAEQRPHLITFYLSNVDDAAHKYGPDSKEAGEAVQYVDSVVNELVKVVKPTGLDVNFIFVSDHGMTRVNNKHPMQLPAVDSTKFTMAGDGILVELYAKPGADVQGTYKVLKAQARNYSVILKKDMPARLHYGTKDDRYNRIGDILLKPNWPYVFKYVGKTYINPGWHGFDPFLVKDVHATFLAWGPAFKKHTQVKAFSNVNVYNIITRILGLTPQEQTDGTNKIAGKVLLKAK